MTPNTQQQSTPPLFQAASDFQKCRNVACPSRHLCLRYTALPDKSFQAYGEFCHNGDRCEHFIDAGDWK